MIGICQSRDPDTMVAEHQDIIVENYSGAAVAVGDALNFVTAASGDGKRVEVPATDNLGAFAGVALEAKGTSEAVLVRSKGWCPLAQYLSTTGLDPGDKLITVNTKPYFAGTDASDGIPAFAVFASTGTVTAGSTALNSAILYGF